MACGSGSGSWLVVLPRARKCVVGDGRQTIDGQEGTWITAQVPPLAGLWLVTGYPSLGSKQRKEGLKSPGPGEESVLKAEDLFGTCTESER